MVIYSAADREYAKPILSAFGRRAEGTEVVPVFDVEASKTVGLVARIEAEQARPRCDVFWNNEIMHTLRLQEAGLLESISWDIPSDWPSDLRSPEGTWLGIAARARILLVNTEIAGPREEWPTGVSDLIDPKWKDNFAFALPLAGTTATHFAILDQQMGSEKSADFFRALRDNGRVLSGNKQVAQAVSAGEVAFGLTDTDDALIEIDAGLPVEIYFPDQGPDRPGTLRIPNTIAVLKGSPHPVAAKALANYLVSEDTEGRLAMGPSGQFPVRPNHPRRSRAMKDKQIRWMSADFSSASERWPELAKELRVIFKAE